MRTGGVLYMGGEQFNDQSGVYNTYPSTVYLSQWPSNIGWITSSVPVTPARPESHATYANGKLAASRYGHLHIAMRSMLQLIIRTDIQHRWIFLWSMR